MIEMMARIVIIIVIIIIIIVIIIYQCICEIVLMFYSLFLYNEQQIMSKT